MWFYIDSMEKTHTHKKNRREDHGGWRRAHCRNAHVLHCLLKIILSADLLPFLKLGSITNSHTNNPNSERGKKLVQNHGKNKKKVSPHVTCPASPQTLSMGPNFLFFLFFLVFSRLLPPWPKNVPKPMDKKKFHPMSPVQLLLRPSPWVETFCFFSFFGVLDVFATLAQKCTKTYGRKKKFHPMSPVQLPLRPSPWVETFFFCFFWFSRGCCHLGPKMSQNPWEKKKFHPMSPVQLPLRPSPWVETFCFFLFFFCFLEVAATANNISCSFFVFFVFLFLGFLGEIFTSIGTAFTPPHFILMSSLSCWFWLLSHQRKCTVKTARLYHPPL